MTYRERYGFFVSCCAVFILSAPLLAGLGQNMFLDADPFWHIAAGDWIRQHRAVPITDPWSFTSGEYRWLNISWLWDSVFSYAHEQAGWHGAIALNALTTALTLTLIYAACLQRSGNGIAAFLVTLGAMTMLNLLLRPLQVTHAMTALWLLILGSVARGYWRKTWLILLPLTMALWVNMHGGFITGLALLGAFFVQAAWQRDTALTRALVLSGIGASIAIMCNPYGIGIVEAVWRPMTTVANGFLHEWQPFSASPGALLFSFYAVAFILLVPHRALPILTVERWLAYLWLVLGLMSIRYLSIFAIIAAPALACVLSAYLAPKRPPTALAAAIGRVARRAGTHPVTALTALLICIGLALWLPGSRAAAFYRQQSLPTLTAEIEFLNRHYPHARILNHFDLGGLLEYETQGSIPVFMDGRTETAYPAQVMKDYMDFEMAAPGWEKLLDRYAIDIIMLPNKGRPTLMDRFDHRHGWKVAFKGPEATIIMREQ